MPVEISDWNDLDNVRNDLTGDYVLVNDLDSETAGYAGIGDDFNRLGVTGFDGTPFSGSFDGDGFEIRDFVLGDDGIDDGGQGLFGGVGDGGLVENLRVSGTVDLTGFSSATSFFAGGLAGTVATSGTASIQNCVSHVDVTSPGGVVGGLVGQNDDSVINSYATESVEGDAEIGGLVGRNRETIDSSYAVGYVNGNEDVGGLLGRNLETVINSYAIGPVEGDSNIGGLVGENLETIETSYAVGSVNGNTNVGGLVGNSGSSSAAVIDSYWDTESTGQSTSDGDGTGLTTAEMQGGEAETNMQGFDFSNVWDAVLESDDDTTADGYPILLSVERDDQLIAQGIEDLFDLLVETNAATDVSTFGATLNGELVELDAEADDADVFFEFGETVGENQTDVQVLSTLDTFDEAVEITTSDQTIEFRAVAEAENADGETFVDEGDTLTFTTDTATVEGVINPDDPIEGAVVKAENKSTGESYGRDETDADGQYAFANISGLEIGQMLELLVDAKLPDEDENLSTVLAPTVGEPGN